MLAGTSLPEGEENLKRPDARRSAVSPNPPTDAFLCSIATDIDLSRSALLTSGRPGVGVAAPSVTAAARLLGMTVSMRVMSAGDGYE
jgi:hypothetical protein